MSRLGVASVEPNEPCIKRRPHPPWEGHFLEDACWPIMKFSNYAELWTCGVVVWIRLHSTTPTVSLRGCRRVRRVGEDVSVGVVECGHSAYTRLHWALHSQCMQCTSPCPNVRGGDAACFQLTLSYNRDQSVQSESTHLWSGVRRVGRDVGDGSRHVNCERNVWFCDWVQMTAGQRHHRAAAEITQIIF